MIKLQIILEDKIYTFKSGFRDCISNFIFWRKLITGERIHQISKDNKETDVEKFYFFLNYWDQFNK